MSALLWAFLDKDAMSFAHTRTHILSFRETALYAQRGRHTHPATHTYDTRAAGLLVLLVTKAAKILNELFGDRQVFGIEGVIPWGRIGPSKERANRVV